MADDLLPQLIPYFGCVIEPVGEGLQLRGVGRPHMNAAAITPRTFRAPFTLRTSAKTDSTNLRLYWHVGEVILNWECDVRQLRVHHPDTGQQVGLEGRGFITTNAWHDVTWEIQPTRMRLLVDGDIRYEATGSWQEINAPLGIGPCFGSIVVVRSFVVES